MLGLYTLEQNASMRDDVPMTLDLSLTSIVAFGTALAILISFSVLDIRDRKVSNHLVLIGGVIGFAITVISGHLAQNSLLAASCGTPFCGCSLLWALSNGSYWWSRFEDTGYFEHR